jgi:hypothetical protein
MDPPLAATQAISASASIESVMGRRCRRSIAIEAESTAWLSLLEFWWRHCHGARKIPAVLREGESRWRLARILQ